MTVQQVLRANADPAKAAFFPRFFKSGPGEYGEGDKFLGVTVPKQRSIAKQYKDVPLPEIEKLLISPWHEERLVALFILVLQYAAGNEAQQKEIYDFYLSHSKYVNNWDLVDSSAMQIVGAWLENRPDKMAVLTKLAKSDLLWERRIAMVATGYYIRRGKADEALSMAELLLNDKHDLIQKAVGWMLREVGKSVDKQLLLQFLDNHAPTMPRTTLRYAIEHLTPLQRQTYMSKK